MVVVLTTLHAHLIRSHIFKRRLKIFHQIIEIQSLRTLLRHEHNASNQRHAIVIEKLKSGSFRNEKVSVMKMRLNQAERIRV